MFEVNYLRGKYDKRSAAPLMPSIVFCILLWGSWQWYKKLFWRNCFSRCSLWRIRLVYVFGVFTFSFCYSFYEGFIHKIILVSLFLPFICISYPLKVFKFDTGILRDSCAVPLLKTLSRLPQSIAFLCLILFLMFACNNYPFRAFVTMIYWTSTEVLLNLVAPLDSAVPSFDF